MKTKRLLVLVIVVTLLLLINHTVEAIGEEEDGSIFDKSITQIAAECVDGTFLNSQIIVITSALPFNISENTLNQLKFTHEYELEMLPTLIYGIENGFLSLTGVITIGNENGTTVNVLVYYSVEEIFYGLVYSDIARTAIGQGEDIGRQEPPPQCGIFSVSRDTFMDWLRTVADENTSGLTSSDT